MDSPPVSAGNATGIPRRRPFDEFVPVEETAARHVVERQSAFLDVFHQRAFGQIQQPGGVPDGQLHAAASFACTGKTGDTSTPFPPAVKVALAGSVAQHPVAVAGGGGPQAVVAVRQRLQVGVAVALRILAVLVVEAVVELVDFAGVRIVQALPAEDRVGPFSATTSSRRSRSSQPRAIRSDVSRRVCPARSTAPKAASERIRQFCTYSGRTANDASARDNVGCSAASSPFGAAMPASR
jgi:hypothetical protein